MNSYLGKILMRHFHATSKCMKQCVIPSSSGSIPPPATIGGYKIYQKLFIFVALPAILLAMANAYNLKMKHDDCDRPPFVKYEYMRRITKRYPWGDGTKSLFHNPKKNALPDGYEDEE